MKRILSFTLAFVLCISILLLPQASVLASSRETPAQITGLSISTGNKSKQLKLSWNKQPKADGYQIYRSTTGKTGSYKKIATLSDSDKNSYKDTGLKDAKTYYYAARAFCKTNGKAYFGKFAKANLSTRLTKEAVQKKIVAANKFFIGWMLHCYEAWNYADYNDTKPVPGEDSDWLCYVRIKSNKYQSVADLKREAAKLFTKSFYEDYIDGIYADIDGKLYIKSYDQGGDGGVSKGSLKFLSLTDKACKVKDTASDPYSDYSYPFVYKMVYINGRWLFKTMIDSFSIYYQGNNYWKEYNSTILYNSI